MLDASGWADLTTDFWASAEGASLEAFLEKRRSQGATIYPPEPLRALLDGKLQRIRGQQRAAQEEGEAGGKGRRGAGRARAGPRLAWFSD